MYFSIIAFAISTLWICPVAHASPCADLPKGSEIVQCNLIYRHGDRAPVLEYPNSKYKNPSFWPDGWGQLSLKGMKQHFNLGLSLMKQYGPTGKNLIPSTYNHSLYKVYSTNYDRTIMSGLANSAGLYYPQPGDGISDDIPWKPIPIRAAPDDENDVIFAQACPYAKKTLKILWSQKSAELRDANREIFQYIQDNSGYPVFSDPENIMMLSDILECEKLTYELPDWAQKLYPYPLHNFSIEFFKQYTRTEKLTRLTAGPLLKTVVDNMIGKAIGDEVTNMFSYSGHDTHIYSVLDAMRIPPQERPGYASAIIFELYKASSRDFYVQVLYLPGPDEEPYPMIIPGCDGKQFCPLNDFILLISRIIPEDLKNECKLES